MFKKLKAFARAMQDEFQKQPPGFQFDPASYTQGWWAGFEKGVKEAERVLRKLRKKKEKSK